MGWRCSGLALKETHSDEDAERAEFRAYFDELLGFIAGEANDSGRVRQERLDVLYEGIAESTGV